MNADKTKKGEGWEDFAWHKTRYNDRTVLKSGSFLNTFCPHCGESLIRNNMVHLETVTMEGLEGWVDLSPYLNVFEKRSDIRLPPGQEVKDLCCWRCHASLKVAGHACGRDESPVACVMIGISSIRVPFFFCMREGCHWQQIDPEDQHKIILDDSMEW